MLKNIKAILLDLDGTVYRGNEVIEGVPETIAKLRKQGMKIFFISNASMKTREEQMEKLRSMGIDCELNEIYNTAFATAGYIKKNYPDARVYVISEGGLKKEIEKAGIAVIDNENANVVAIGLDTKLTFEKLATALRAILDGAEFIASNVDRVYPTERGWLPGSGTIAAFLEYGTKKKPIVIGKPEPHLIRAVLENEKLKKNEVLIVGDNYETDLKAAKEMKMECALVLTGLTKKKDVDKLPKTERPDFVLARLADLPANLQ